MLCFIMVIIGSVGTSLTISFTSSWKFSLGYIGFIPIVIALNLLKMNTLETANKKDQKSAEVAGKVRVPVRIEHCGNVFRSTERWNSGILTTEGTLNFLGI